MSWKLKLISRCLPNSFYNDYAWKERKIFEKNPSDGLHYAYTTAVQNTYCNSPALTYELLVFPWLIG